MDLPIFQYDVGTIVQVPYPYYDDLARIKKENEADLKNNKLTQNQREIRKRNREKQVRYKDRPVLILEKSNKVYEVLVLKITSKQKRTPYDIDITFKDFKTQSMKKSVVRIKHRVYVNPNYNCKLYGEIDKESLRNVKIMYNVALNRKVEFEDLILGGRELWTR